MLITLHRSGHRALFVRVGTDLATLPSHVIEWLGPIETSADSRLDVDTPMLGLMPSAVMNDIEAHGYCALDAPSGAPA